MKHLIELLSVYAGHKFAAMILFLFLGFAAFFYTGEYLVTNTVFAMEKQQIMQQIQQGDDRIRLDILYGQLSSLKRSLWEFQDLYESTNKDKWRMRSDDAQEDIDKIKIKIDKLSR